MIGIFKRLFRRRERKVWIAAINGDTFEFVPTKVSKEIAVENNHAYWTRKRDAVKKCKRLNNE